MVDLGVHTFAFAQEWQPATARDVLPGLLRHGVKLIEIPLLRPAEIDVAGTRTLGEEFGIKFACSLGLPADFDIVERPDQALDFLEVALDVTAALGAPYLSGVTYGTIGKTSGQPPTEREKQAVTALLASAGAAAKQRNLRLGVEPCNRYETHLMNTAEDAVRFIEAAGTDNVFIHLDTYHMNIEEAGMAAGFRAAGRHLGYVHLSESNRGVPGTGTIDWRDAMAGLKAIDYDGAVVLESFNHMHPDIASGLAVWKPAASAACTRNGSPLSVTSPGLAATG
ncbi:MAG: sugar phosphate isomerase/epimerase family protein, partial [Pseudomonadota bacterium]